MNIETKVFNDKRVFVVKVTSSEAVGAEKKDRQFYHNFQQTIITELRSHLHDRLEVPPLLAIDFGNLNLSFESFKEHWFFPIARYKAGIFSYKGALVFCGVKLEPTSERANSLVEPSLDTDKWVEKYVEPSLEIAIEKWMEGLTAFTTDREVVTPNAAGSSPSLRICLVGCPEMDILDLPEEFVKFGIEVVTSPPTSDADYLIFCLNSSNGPMPGTRAAVAACRDNSLRPLAIVFTNSSLTDDDSLRELIEMEERELLSTILAIETVDSLPVLQDLDPMLVSKVLKLIDAYPD